MPTVNKLLVVSTVLLLSSTAYLGYSNSQLNDKLQQKDSEIQNLKQEENRMEDKIYQYKSQLSECNQSLKIAQSELFKRKSFSSRSYMNGILTESYNSIEDAYDACKRKVSDLEDELRRCKNGW